jgi:hypothetical protein
MHDVKIIVVGDDIKQQLSSLESKLAGFMNNGYKLVSSYYSKWAGHFYILVRDSAEGIE